VARAQHHLTASTNEHDSERVLPQHFTFGTPGTLGDVLDSLSFVHTGLPKK
jgi:hypothetical protein